MEEMIQVKGLVPRTLKRKAFAALAAREERFTHWLRTALEEWVVEVERQQNVQQEREPSHAAAEKRYRDRPTV